MGTKYPVKSGIGQFGFDIDAGAVAGAGAFDTDLRRNLSFRSAGKAVGSDDVIGTVAGAAAGTAQCAINGAKSRSIINGME